MVVVLYFGKGTTARQRSTDALTGFRMVNATAIVLEHLFKLKLPLNGSGSFFVLSGCVLSMSRTKQAGVLKQPFTSMRDVAKFWFLRLMRVLPLYWLGRAVLSTQCGRGHHASCTPLSFLLEVVANVLNMPFASPTEFFLLDKQKWWFIPVIVQLYIMYPLLEFAVFGGDGVAPITRVTKAGAMAALAKYAVLGFMFFLLHSGRAEANHDFHIKAIVGPCLELPKGWERSLEPFPARRPGGKCQLDFYFNVVPRVPDFVIGMLLPHISFQSDIAVTCADIALVAVTGLFVLMLVWQPIWFLVFCHFNGLGVITALCIWAMCFGPRQSLLGRVLSNPLLVAGGNFSYGVYVWGMMVSDGTPHKPFQFTGAVDWGLAVVLLEVVYLISWTTYWICEEPCGDVARWVVGHTSSRSMPVATEDDIAGTIRTSELGSELFLRPV
eukprot:TRINITY_DN32386_c0_g1_i1.p1 TRINITY_DN32386_c0_g1~~TRINITY_DN32386_c0_g1_i1.p1  ORF type:complete len:499 (+),score=13.97 TRINITY_DN32386_c0_g1_i1:183-1499(+)